MTPTTPTYFDLETVALIREVLDEAWGSLRPQQRAAARKSSLAARILESTAKGERDRGRLRAAALSNLGT